MMNNDTLYLLVGLREMTSYEQAHIEAACTEARDVASTSIAKLSSQIDTAVLQALDQLPLSDDDLASDQLPQTLERIRRCLSGTARRAAATQGIALERDVSRLLASATYRLGSFALACDTLLAYACGTLLQPGTPALEAPDETLTVTLEGLARTYEAISASSSERAPFRTGDLAALLSAIEPGSTLALLPVSLNSVTSVAELRGQCHAATRTCIETLAPDACAYGTYLIHNLIVAEFRALALELDRFVDRWWCSFEHIPALSFKAAPPMVSPTMLYQPVSSTVIAQEDPNDHDPFKDIFDALVRGSSQTSQPRPSSETGAAEHSALPGLDLKACPHCGAMHKPEHRFCGSCGAVVLPEAAKPADPPISFCIQCGTMLQPGHRFCGTCGTAVADEPAIPPLCCPRCASTLQPDTVICPSCGLVAPLAQEAALGAATTSLEPQHESFDGSDFARGQRKEATQSAVPNPGAPAPGTGTTRPCSRCKKPVAIAAAWCSECGAPTK